MNCSILSAHLYSLHVVNSLAWFQHINTADHTANYFLDYPLSYTQRITRRNVVTTYTQFSIKVLLKSDRDNDHEKNAAIIQAVHDFIKDCE